ncbi:hypothetical protein CCMSSC00406_0008319 [Pleurotus cornucopiae]|uniref:Uncharacterized protein n=1 Tax=Pleurotus cornucopiae TaxID=5321 RepID=A0ACB7ITX4_PLECO|nr:hypothetical protein CCMSSC00406_0008319 [Pleurotus cornucopiae]
MGRGRPRIYKTPEDKAAANRAKSMRSYYNRKYAINVGRRRRYRADTSKTKPLNSAHPDAAALPNADPVNASDWLCLVNHSQTEFDCLTKGSTRAFVESLYDEYTTNNYRLDTFSKALIELRALDRTMRRCEHALLQLVGVAKEFKVAEKLGQAVRNGLNCVEEMELYASIGKEEVLEAYENHDLMHQKLDY